MKKYVRPKRKVLKVTVQVVENGHESDVVLLPYGRNYNDYGDAVIELINYLFEKDIKR